MQSRRGRRRGATAPTIPCTAPAGRNCDVSSSSPFRDLRVLLVNFLIPQVPRRRQRPGVLRTMQSGGPAPFQVRGPVLRPLSRAFHTCVRRSWDKILSGLDPLLARRTGDRPSCLQTAMDRDYTHNGLLSCFPFARRGGVEHLYHCRMTPSQPMTLRPFRSVLAFAFTNAVTWMIILGTPHVLLGEYLGRARSRSTWPFRRSSLRRRCRCWRRCGRRVSAYRAQMMLCWVRARR
jgi:hypothetical protein